MPHFQFHSDLRKELRDTTKYVTLFKLSIIILLITLDFPSTKNCFFTRVHLVEQKELIHYPLAWGIPQILFGRSHWFYQNTELTLTKLHLAWHEERCPTICQILHWLPTHEVHAAKATLFASAYSTSYLPLGRHSLGLHHRSPCIPKSNCNSNSSRSFFERCSPWYAPHTLNNP